MKDFKTQLASIKPLVNTQGKENSSPKVESQQTSSFKKTSLKKEDLCLSRLPLLGRVKNYKEEQGYGFISANRIDYFFHVSSRITFGKDSFITLGENVLFILGSPKKSHVGHKQVKHKREVVSWCYVNDIWQNGGPASQNSLNALRLEWFSKQTIELIFQVIEADWYRLNFALGKADINLQDSVLHSSLVEQLKVLESDDWVRFAVKDRLNNSLFSFSKDWHCSKSEEVPRFLIDNFTADQLSTLRNPRYKWFCACNKEFEEAKLFEWAMRCSLSDSEKEEWCRELDDDYSWYGEVLFSLLSTDWCPFSEVIPWIKRVLEDESVEPELIIDRLKRFPEEKGSLFEILDDAHKIKYLVNQPEAIDEIQEIINKTGNIELYEPALLYSAFAIDLEADGDNIWEIGVANKQDKWLMLSRNDSTNKSDSVYRELESKLSKSKLVIGHNILTWDLPILEEELSIKKNIIVWDTMYVQFMISPWAPTHALLSDHKADNDASASFKLFENQLTTLGPEIAKLIFNNEINSSKELIGIIGDILLKKPWDGKSLAPNCQKLLEHISPGQTLVVPAYYIKKLDWAPNIVVIAIDDAYESFGLDLLVIDINYLMSNLKDNGLESHLGDVLINVIKKSNIEGISIRLSMLPYWVKEKKTLTDLIKSSLVRPSLPNGAVGVAKLPSDENWFYEIDDKYVVVSDSFNETLITKIDMITESKLLTLQANHKQGFSSNIDVSPLKSTAIYKWVVNKNNCSYDLWATLDVASKSIAKSGKCWRTYRTHKLRNTTKLFNSNTIANLSHAKPKLLARDEVTFFPSTEDQASYWTEILLIAKSIKQNQSVGIVPVLLIVSSHSLELIKLLDGSLSAVGCNPKDMSYTSRAEKLLRVSNQGGVIVDFIDNWSSWNDLSESCGVKLFPLIEALPIEQWYVTSEVEDARLANKLDDDSHGFEEGNDIDFVGITDEFGMVNNQLPELNSSCINYSDVNKKIYTLIKSNMNIWLNQVGLEDNLRELLILDSRLNDPKLKLMNLFDLFEMPGSYKDSYSERIFLDALEVLQIVREEAQRDYNTMRNFLQTHWNKGKNKGGSDWIHDFRDVTQKPALEEIRKRDADVLVKLPTGEGKSILFQVPSLCCGLKTRRLSIVISPLKALMQDQVEGLWNLGFHQSVDFLSSDRMGYEISDVLQGVLDHRIVLLYVAPERFRNKRFLDFLGRRFDSDGSFEYVIVDEAHCVSQWGHDFRPDYFYALDVICNRFRNVTLKEKTPIILLSATVTKLTKDKLEDIVKGQNKGSKYLPFLVRPDKYSHPIREHILIEPRYVDGLIFTKPKEDWPIGPRIDVIEKLISRAKKNKKETKQHSTIIIFVGWREHAEKLSFLISELGTTNIEVDYFHAGLDAGTKENVLQRSRDGEIDVLVSTKAFGMGMDIPHIHWSFHLSPPSYLEDYLQEVGRIGRGKKERESAQLSNLEAVLFYSDQDFQNNKSNIKRGQIDYPQIDDLFNRILNDSREVSGMFFSIMPDYGFQEVVNNRRAEITRVRKILYWLERIELVNIISMIPDLLPMLLHREQLQRIIKDESGPILEVAEALISIDFTTIVVENLHHDTQNHQQTVNDEIIGKIINGVNNLFGFLLGGPVPKSKNKSKKKNKKNSKLSYEKKSCEGIVNLGQIWRATSLSNVDDVLTILIKLEARNAIQITRQIGFSKLLLFNKPENYLKYMFTKLESFSSFVLYNLMKSSGYVIQIEAIKEELINNNYLPQTEHKIVALAIEQTTCVLLKSIGVKIRERLIKDEKRELVATLITNKGLQKQEDINFLIKQSKALWEVFKSLDKEGTIEVSTLVQFTTDNSATKHYSRHDLERNLRILASLKLIRVTESIIPNSYLLAVNNNSKVDTTTYVDVWSELENVNRVNELRGDAMEIFAHLTSDFRSHFIEGYFSKSSAVEMEEFLDQQIRLVDEGESSTGGFVQVKLAQLRATAVEDFFSKYKVNAEETNQWLAIKHPFSENLLVNAGPGSGKTSVLIARIVHLIREQHLHPEQILVLAFNRAVIFEIRRKIKELFFKLGYGAYVSRLKIYTFHSFAAKSIHASSTKYLNSNDLKGDYRNKSSELLPKFLKALDLDAAFHREVTKGIKSVLVDEFQDVNDDIYKIIQIISATSGSRVGVMAIGDDDQDIFKWNRKNKESSELYFDKFLSEFAPEIKNQLALRVNFRSGPEIVSESQKYLDDFFNTWKGGGSRLKSEKLRSSIKAHSSTVIRNEITSIDELASIWSVRNKELVNESIAILCRTNSEVAQVYQILSSLDPSLEIQNGVDYQVGWLRHIACWIEVLEDELKNNSDCTLTEELFDRLFGVFSQQNIPEINGYECADISELWDLCHQERYYPFISHLISFLEEITLSELTRLKSADSKNTERVVSTIHKVKGLEFDNVIIINPRQKESDEEETRISYVAMTRAKKRLDFYILDRIDEASNKVLVGDIGEVRISWSLSQTPWNLDPEASQEYIKENVHVGDRLEIGGQGEGAGFSIFHNKTQVGFLSNENGSGRVGVTELFVSAVLKYPNKFELKYAYGGSYLQKHKDQGWGWLVLVRGVLR